MISDSYRQTLTFAMLAFSIVVSVAYDTVPFQINEGSQQLLAVVMAGCLAVIVMVQRYSLPVLSRAIVYAWPLHLFSLAFVGVCVGFHGGAKLSQVIGYTYFAYATYVIVPMILRVDQPMFRAYKGTEKKREPSAARRG